jgi:cation diffusion facilitator CzcD-associated flavoprotein CzcO
MTEQAETDVAVVGAGLAGLVAARRLSAASEVLSDLDHG